MMLRGILCGTVASLSSLSTYQATPRTPFTSVDLNLRFQSNQTSLDILQAALTDVKTGYNGGVACCAAFILNHPAIQGSCSMQDAILFSKDMRLTWGQMILSLETRWHSSSPLQLPGSGVLLSKIPLEKHSRAPIRVYHEMPGCLGLEFVLDLGAPRATSTTVSLTPLTSASQCLGVKVWKSNSLPCQPCLCLVRFPLLSIHQEGSWNIHTVRTVAPEIQSSCSRYGNRTVCNECGCDNCCGSGLIQYAYACAYIKYH